MTAPVFETFAVFPGMILGLEDTSSGVDWLEMMISLFPISRGQHVTSMVLMGLWGGEQQVTECEHLQFYYGAD